MCGLRRSFAPAALISALALLAACQSQNGGGSGANDDPASTGGKAAGGGGGKAAGGGAGKGASGAGGSGAGGLGGVTPNVPDAGGTAGADAGLPSTGDAGADASPAALAAFIGRWVYESGQESLSCMGKPPQANSLAGVELLLTPGQDSPLVLANDACSFALEVAGNVASARPGQTCKLMNGASMLVYALTSLSFTVEGTTAMETSMWSIDFIDPSGNLRCPYTTIGRLRRLP